MSDHIHDASNHREKHSVALTSLLAAVAITAFKIVVGFSTGSLGILAEAAHSSLDLVASAATLVSLRLADKPADREHPYGHGKIENLSALFQVVLLLVTCGWIFYEAIQRLFFVADPVEVNIWSFAVIITSLVVDFSRSRALSRAAKKHNSQALEADALHFETDIYSSIAVLIGLVCVLLSAIGPSLNFLRHADAVAALAVAFISILITWRLGKRTLAALIDAAPPDLDQKIKDAAEAVPGVIDCHQIRVRTSGPQLFIDVHVLLDGSQTLTHAHALTETIEKSIRAFAPNADITVHPEPVDAHTPH